MKNLLVLACITMVVVGYPCSAQQAIDSRYANNKVRLFRESSNGQFSFYCLQGSYNNPDPRNGSGCSKEVGTSSLSEALLLALDGDMHDTASSLATMSGAVTSNSQQLTTVSQQMTEINSALIQKVDQFTSDVRKAINDRFQTLPTELAASPAIQLLKRDIEADIMKQVNATLTSGNQIPHTPK